MNLFKKLKILNRYKKIITTVSILILCLFTFRNSYKWVLSRLLYLPKKLEILKLAKFQNCRIKEIRHIPKEFSVVIGHAYGSPNIKKEFLSGVIDNFLSKNIDKIENIFLTGDVFSIPSKEKWEKLNNKYGNKSNIIIAPGNHDIGIKDLQKKKIFENSELYKNEFPYLFASENFNFIIEDSISNNWRISQPTIDLINIQSNNLKTILLRHNIPVKEFFSLSNSNAGYKKSLLSKQKLDSLLNKDVIIISGDGGAFSNLPRFFCHKFGKITYIINGIGEVAGDSVILIENSSIFRYNLN